MSEPYEPKDPNVQSYLTLRRLQSWTPVITVVLSTLALVVIGFQAIIYNQQRRVMNEQRAVMDKQLQTMNGQLDSMNKTLIETQKGANAAVVSAEAAKTSAESTADMAVQNRELIKAAKTQSDASLIQAKTSQVSAGAAADSAQIARQSYEEAQRPQIYFTASRMKEQLKPDTKVKALFSFGNSGKRAEAFTVEANWAIRPAAFVGDLPIDSLTSDNAPDPLEQNGATYVAPEFGVQMSGEIIKKVTDGDLLLIFFGHLRYEDRLRRKYVVPFCRYYHKAMYPDLAVCPARIHVP